jgi:hypothetical protein
MSFLRLMLLAALAVALLNRRASDARLGSHADASADR